ncbi:hypothetical protein [Sphingobium sp. HWE2-09]|uniref:hypothetical protein n=1 Tax=Sphingobium sp. HWE2-09 TaxID=3108390 RepID=UPI002DCF271B|nr:hypothetical protein [Sphingobium sp. HWE2-09]
MRKKKLAQSALIYGIALTLFAVGFSIRFLSLPMWIDLTMCGIIAAPIIWMGFRGLIKRQTEKRLDKETAWRMFITGRKIH